MGRRQTAHVRFAAISAVLHLSTVVLTSVYGGAHTPCGADSFERASVVVAMGLAAAAYVPLAIRTARKLERIGLIADDAALAHADALLSGYELARDIGGMFFCCTDLNCSSLVGFLRFVCTILLM